MKKTLVLLVLSVSFAVLLQARPAPVLSFGGCEEDCQKCHNLQLSEAQEILSKMKLTAARVTGVKMSPIRGLWEVTAEERGSRRILYVGFSKKYVVGGSIIEVETTANKTRETLDMLNRPPDRFVDMAQVSLDGALVMGDNHAPVRVVVFTDPDCPYCSKFHEEMKKVISTRKDIAFYLKLFPLKMHPDAFWKSQSILCSGSLDMLEENYLKKPIPRPACDGTGIDKNIQAAAVLGITGTPTLVLPDGLVLSGTMNASALIDLIMQHIKKG
jgi:thiol:disulfide interchange protein DsbC